MFIFHHSPPELFVAETLMNKALTIKSLSLMEENGTDPIDVAAAALYL